MFQFLNEKSVSTVAIFVVGVIHIKKITEWHAKLGNTTFSK